MLNYRWLVNKLDKIETSLLLLFFEWVSKPEVFNDSDIFKHKNITVIINSLPQIVKSIPKQLPASGYPVLDSRI
jgi:hypothetical protein